MGDVIGDLNSRRGQVQEMSTRGNANVVDAMVPSTTCLDMLIILDHSPKKS